MTLRDLFHRGGTSFIDPDKLREIEVKSAEARSRCMTSIERSEMGLERALRRVNDKRPGTIKSP